MRTKSDALAVKLAGGAALGAGIGGALTLWQLLRELDVFRMMLDSSAPETTATLVFASLISLCAVGAGVVGFTMLAEDKV
jgi:hypothetical protein